MAVLAGCGSGGSQPPTTATGPTVASVTPVPDRGAKTTTTGAGKRTAAGAHATKHAAQPATGKTPPAAKATHGATPKPTTTPITPTTSTIKPPANPVLAGTLPGVLPLARTSVGQVVLLHDLAVGTTHLAGAPPGVGGAGPAAQLATTLSGEAEQLKVPAGSAQPSGVALLTASLNGYAGLAKQLATRPATDTTPLSAAFVATLRKLDGRWTAALVAIGSANHVKLLAGMAPLLMPHSG
jgi:hypothetical protein